MPSVRTMIRHFSVRNQPLTRRGKTGSRAAYRRSEESEELIFQSGTVGDEACLEERGRRRLDLDQGVAMA
ncbi:hypothetical protein GCM10011392_08280 [Wenxinia marina]|nr:hypothetical protein GCM10011392_08280 [Wenxinia marina]